MILTNTENILRRFLLLAGLSDSESSQWEELAEDCAVFIASQINSTADTSENRRVLESAAAALAFYRYCVSRDAQRELSSFSTGEVRFDMAGSCASEAYKLYEQAMEACRPLLKSSEFVFERTDSLCTES